MVGELPTSLEVAGVEYEIDTDYRNVLRILCAFNDPVLENEDKIHVCLCNLFYDYEAMPHEHYEEAFKKALVFIDTGSDPEQKGKPSPRIMDWEQDEGLLFPAVNKIAGYEVRSAEYVHWWTFIGWYMEITDGVFAHILSLRSKKAKGEKLDKYERKFWNANKKLCVLTKPMSDEEKEERDRINKLLS
jgi:hypothetical protein